MSIYATRSSNVNFHGTAVIGRGRRAASAPAWAFFFVVSLLFASFVSSSHAQNARPSPPALPSPKPTTPLDLTASDVRQTSATLTLTGHAEAWWYKGDQPGATCTRVSAGTNTASLSNLKGKTSYVYRVYSDSQCSAEIASATFTTIVLDAGAVTQTTATLTLTGHTAAWWYERTTPSGGTCTKVAANMSTASLSTLTSGTSYTYKAYNKAGCEAEDEIASATFTTLMLDAGAITRTTATLTLTGHAAAWWYEYTTPSGGTCTKVGAGTPTAALSDLTVNTSYTYKAYSASGCDSTKEIATVTFTTRTVGLAASDVRATSATLTISNHTAKWWYKHNQSHAICTSVAANQPTASLSNLRVGRVYVVKAYSASGCSSSSEIARETFTTLSLDVSAVTQTTATLTLTGHTAAWSYKRTTPAGGACKDVAAGTSTASLSDLTGGTTYTYEAYKAAGCSSANKIASSIFYTVSLAAGAVEATTATLTITNYPGSYVRWYYKHTSPAGGACSLRDYGVDARLKKLSTGTTYTYRAYTDGNCSAWLATAPAFLTKPDKVSGLSVATRDRGLGVSWTAETGAASYKVQWKSVGQNWSTLTPAPTGTSATITGLTNGTQYTVRVTATNATGDGAASDTMTGTPSAVTLSAGSVTATTARLTISGHAAAWWYKGSQSGATCTSVAINTATADLSSLSTGTSYTYKAYGNSSCSTELAAAPAFLTQPGKVSGVTVSALRRGLAVSWTAQTGTASYKVQWKSGQNWDTLTPSPTGTSATITGLTNGTQYTVRVTATNATGDGAASDTVTGTPVNAPAKPAGFTATGKSRAADLAWTNPNDGTITKWQYRYKTKTGSYGGWTDVPSSGAATTSYTVTGLTNGKLYTFGIRAVNANGNGAASDEQVSATVPAGPDSFEAKPLDTVVELEWTNPDNESTITQWQYRYRTKTGSYGNWIEISNPTRAGAYFRHRVSLAVGAYYFQVRGVNARGVGDPSPQEQAVLSTGICNRTQQVEDAILTKLSQKYPDKTWTCSNVTSRDLFNIYGTLDLRNKGITSLKVGDFDGLVGVSYLYLSNNALTALPAGVFAGMQPQYLSLENNALTTLPADVFKDARIGWKLVLSGNPLTSLPAALFQGEGVRRIWSLHIDNTALTTLPADLFKGMTNLGIVHLRNNKLTTLSADVFDSHPYLDWLRVNGNDLTTLPAGLFDSMPNLELLHLFDNELASLRADAFAGLSKLQELRLDGNQLKTLPATVFKGLSSLTSLNLSRNLLGKDTSTLPAGLFEDLSKLRSLSLYKNSFSWLQRAIFIRLTGLVQLFLARIGDPLSCLPDIPSSVVNLGVDIRRKYSKCGGYSTDPPTLIAGHRQLGVTWSAPTQTVVTDYDLRYRAGSTGSWRDWSHTGAATSTTITGLTNGTAYQVAVRVHGSTGAGNWSSAATGTPVDDGVITLAPKRVSVPEGGKATYTVKLTAQPSATVTLTLTRSQGDGDLTVDTDPDTSGDQNTLTFTTTNYSTAQTVAVRAAEDDADDLDGTATFTHTASSSDGYYQGVTEDLTAIEADNERGIQLSVSSVSVPEGGTSTYTMRLNTRPTAEVLVTITRTSGDDNLTVDTKPSPGNQNTLRFTSSTWDKWQTVTVAAAEDNDGLDDDAVFTHTASGGNYAGLSATLTATEADNDRGLVLSPSSVSVPEGGTNTYTVKLATRPTGNVTVAVARATAGTPTPDTDLSVKTGASLTFTTTDWNTAQTVTLQAAEDDDGVDGAAKFTHTASGGGYGDVTAELTATEADNEHGMQLSVAGVTVPEGGTNSYTVRLNTRPSATVTVAVTRTSGDDSLSVKTGASLTFTTTDWSTAQTVTLQAAEDNDALNGTAVFTHTASGGNYSGVPAVTLSAAEADNERGVTLSASRVSVPEGGAKAYTVKLASRPVGNVTVAVTWTSGDENLSVKTGASLTFTTTDWSTAQTVTLQAAEDNDALQGSAVFTHTATGGGYGGVSATLTAVEADNEAGYFFSQSSLKVPEGSNKAYTVKLNTQPTATVTVTVTRSLGDVDLSLMDTNTTQPGDQNTLTFTTTNWSTAQTLTLQARNDGDGLDGTAVFTHTGSGGNYTGASATLTATEADDGRDLTGVTSNVTVGEGSTVSFDMWLETQPTADVTVTVAWSSGDRDLSVKSGASVTYTPTAWSHAARKRVTFEAAEDEDYANGTAVFTFTASGGNWTGVSKDVTVRESDNDRFDTKPKLAAPVVWVPENGTTAVPLTLGVRPNASVTVTVTRVIVFQPPIVIFPADTDLTADTDPNTPGNQNTLTFDSTNWDTAQTVTLRAAGDQDALDGGAGFQFEASGDSGSYNGSETLIAYESDNGNTSRALTLSPASVSVPEGGTNTYTVKLAIQPSATATVTVARTSGDNDVSVKTGSSLTFTTANWNTAQTVTLQATEDADGDDDTAVFTHRVSGSDYAAVSATLTATEADNDRAVVVPSSESVSEGGEVTYAVTLATQPDAEVTVTVARKSTGNQDTDITVKAGGSLTFTTTDWNTAQSVTLAAAEDNDGRDGVAVIEHTAASSGNYDGVKAELTVTEADNDRNLKLSRTKVSVPEGGQATYRVALKTEPSEEVTVTVEMAANADEDLTVSPPSLTFATADWDTWQTVTVAAKEDDDNLDGTAVITHTAAGSRYDGEVATVTATEADNDRPQPPPPSPAEALVLSPSAGLTVSEGSAATYTVALATQPSDEVTVTIAREEGSDEDLTARPESLTFTTEDWSTAQTVTVTAAEDEDRLDGQAVFVHTAEGGGYAGVSATVRVTEADNDRSSPPPLPVEALVLSPSAGLTVSEGSAATYTVALATQPSGEVTVTVTREGGGDEDLAANPVELRFTAANWATGQTVRVTAAEDEDGLDGRAVFVHTAEGGGYAGVSARMTATEADNDRSSPPPLPAEALVLSPSAGLTVSEGSAATYTVALATQPSGEVTVTVAREGGSDEDLTARPGSLTFTTVDWSTAQTVRVTAAEDEDGLDGRAVFVHTAEGGGYAGVLARVTAMEADDDRGLELTATELTVSEGSAATYTVALATQPSGEVTVTVTREGGGDEDLTARPESLTFTTVDWSTAQTVRVTAAEDEDGLDGRAVFVHTAEGGGYAGVLARVTAMEADDDRGLELTATELTVSEGSAATYTVALATQPSGEVTVTVTREGGGDEDLAANPVELRFTAANWATGQTVRVTAAEDEDGLDGRAVFVHTAEGGGYAGVLARVTAMEADDDRGLELTATELTVSEGSAATYTVALATQPSGEVTVTVTREGGGDEDLTARPESLTFTTVDWSTAQTVRVTAAEDEDGLDGRAVFVHTAEGGGYTGVGARVTATEADDDRGLELTATELTVSEGSAATYTIALATQPSGEVTVTVTREGGGDEDLAANPVELRFTAANWATGQTVRVTAAEDEDALDGVAVFRHTASGGEYAGVSASLTATEVDNFEEKTEERLSQVNKTVLPEVLSSSVQSKLDNVVSRVGRVVSGTLPQETTSDVALSWIARTLKAHEQAVADGTFSWREALGDVALGLSQSGDSSVGGQDTAGVAFWAMGDYLRLSGGRRGPVDWDGDLLGVHVGGDMRLAPDLLAGLGLSWEEGRFDYTHHDGQDEIAGAYDIRLTSAYPYVGWSSREEGWNLWSAFGYGKGKVEFDDAKAGRHASDAQQAMAAVGGGMRLLSGKGWVTGGTSSLALKGEASLGRLKVDVNRTIRGTTTDAHRVRVAVEGTETMEFASGSSVTPWLEMALRWDGGDGETGMGAELGSGLGYSDPGSGLTVKARGRMLLAHEGDMREWGASGLLRLQPGASGGGPSLQVKQSWGEADTRVKELWERGVADESERKERAPGARLDAELGYGLLEPFGRGGLLTPYAGVGFSEGSGRNYRLGARFELEAASAFSLEGSRREAAEAAVEHALTLQFVLNF